MNVEQLADSAAHGGVPPAELRGALKALWLARAGRWDEAHDLCQQVDAPEGAWVHAYLHRVDGDLGNAAYWYGIAGKTQPQDQQGLEEEWRAMVKELLE